MRLAILTSTDIRHRYFVNALRARQQVVAVGYEETGYNPAQVNDFELTPGEHAIVAEHYSERTRQEQLFFGHDARFQSERGDCAVRRLAPGMLNSPETLAFLERAKPDVVVVYGTNLIKAPLLGHWPGRMINMHLGLSPYYRGTATNFYPLVNGEPHMVGATIHLIDAGIDSGPIFAHARPNIVVSDRPHTIGCKTILAGIETMIGVVELMAKGAISATPQWSVPQARLYLRRDYHPRQVVDLYRRFDAGMLVDYLPRAGALCAESPILQLPRRPRGAETQPPATAAH